MNRSALFTEILGIMTNLNGESTSEMPSEDKVKEKIKEEEETPVIEPVINLLQQLEDYTPTVRTYRNTLCHNIEFPYYFGNLSCSWF